MNDGHPPLGAKAPDFLTVEELNRVIARKVFSMQVLADRVGRLTLENTELMSIVQELQTDLAQTRQLLAELQQSEQVMSPNGGVQVSPGLIMPEA
jgi:hypothetical protein